MPLITGVIPSMHNGVSQQSPLVRAPEQCEEQLNGWASLSEGLMKRPPSEYVAKLLSSTPTNAAIHAINRDAAERYIVVAAAGVLRVFDLNGVEKTVNAPGGWTYLSGLTDYAEDVSMMTVADYTFVVNRRKVVEMDALGADTTADPEYLRWLNRAYGVDDVNVATAPGTEYQYPTSPTIAGALTGTVQSFTKLPTTGVSEGALYRINGTDDSNFKTYYVRYSGGVWDETRKPGMVNAIKPSTMPHALVREGDGTFTFAPFSWAPRRVGAEDTNPNPSFVGRAIQKVVFADNRLGFLAGENVILSCVGDYGNFWRNTVVDLIDSDALSVAAAGTQVSILKDAVTFDDGYLLTSDQTQFSLTNGESGQGPTSIAIRAVTHFEINTRAGMVPMGTEVYYATERNGYAAVHEYSRQADTNSLGASDITAHVPRYIPSGVRAIIPMVGRGALLVATDGDPGALYCYQFYWLSGTEKAQSAWSRWSFGNCTVLSGAYLGGQLYLLLSRADGLYLERLNMQPGAVTEGCEHLVLLDRQETVTGVYNSGDQTTTFTLPFAPVQSLFRLVYGPAFTKPLALVNPSSYTWTSSTTVRVPGNVVAGPCIAGEKYTFRYQFSPVFPRRPGNLPITSGRTQLRTMVVNYRDSGFFRTEVAPYGSDPVVEAIVPAKLAQFSGKVLGDEDLILNAPAFHTGDYRFQVYGKADTATVALVNDTHVPSIFVGAEWEALYWNRASA